MNLLKKKNTLIIILYSGGVYDEYLWELYRRKL